MVVRVARLERCTLRRARKAGVDGGFTLIEMLVTMAVAGILMVAAVAGLNAYSKAQAEKGTANRVVASLRDTGERAQAEGRTYCVSFDSSASWSVWRYSCDPAWSSTSLQGNTITAARVSSGKVQGTATLSAASFGAVTGIDLPTSCGSAGSGSCVYFYPRGIASPGQVDVLRSGASKTYVVKVEGLTGRAYLG